MKSILEKYKTDIEKLEKITGKVIYSKLLKEKNRINFFSKISEVKIGKYLAQEFHNFIEYESVIHKQIPDWLISYNKEKIIVEVLKINLPNIKLTNKIESYEKGEYFIPPSGVFMGLACLSFYDKMKIEDKELKYRKLIEQKGYKMIIGVDVSDWEKRIDVLDIKDSFNFRKPNTECNQFIKNVAWKY